MLEPRDLDSHSQEAVGVSSSEGTSDIYLAESQHCCGPETPVFLLFSIHSTGMSVMVIVFLTHHCMFGLGCGRGDILSL